MRKESAALSALEELEWSATNDTCPLCGTYKKYAVHLEGCTLGEALGRIEGRRTDGEGDTEGYRTIEQGLGVKLRVLDEEGSYVDWSIIAEERNGAGSLKVIADSARIKGRLRNPVVGVYASASNAVILKCDRT